MSAERLSARCKELGLNINRSVLANLENGRRPTISVAELLILAKALEVPPVELITPVDHADIEILPDVHMDPWDALLWIGGKEDPNVDWIRVHDGQVREWLEAAARLGPSGPPRPPGLGPDPMEHVLEDARRSMEKRLVQIRKTMRKLGIRLPALPAELRHIDAPEETES